jgi:hypothetical protein
MAKYSGLTQEQLDQIDGTFKFQDRARGLRARFSNLGRAALTAQRIAEDTATRIVITEGSRVVWETDNRDLPQENIPWIPISITAGPPRL